MERLEIVGIQADKDDKNKKQNLSRFLLILFFPIPTLFHLPGIRVFIFFPVPLALSLAQLRSEKSPSLALSNLWLCRKKKGVLQAQWPVEGTSMEKRALHESSTLILIK